MKSLIRVIAMVLAGASTQAVSAADYSFTGGNDACLVRAIKKIKKSHSTLSYGGSTESLLGVQSDSHSYTNGMLNVTADYTNSCSLIMRFQYEVQADQQSCVVQLVNSEADCG